MIVTAAGRPTAAPKPVQKEPAPAPAPAPAKPAAADKGRTGKSPSVEPAPLITPAARPGRPGRKSALAPVVPAVSLPPARRSTPPAAARGRAHAGPALARPPVTIASPVPVPGPAAERAPPAIVPAAGGPDPVDLHVGQRLRDRRLALGLSQSALAEHLGLTFQQVQKYERGANRLSASTLFRAAEAVDVPVSFFFDGLPPVRSGNAPPAPGAATLTILHRIAALPPAARTRVLQLLALLVPEG